MSAAEKLTALGLAEQDIARRDREIARLERRLQEAHERIGELAAELERERAKR